MPDSFNCKIIYSDKTTVSCQHMTKLKSGPKLRLTQVQEFELHSEGVLFFSVSGHTFYISKCRGFKATLFNLARAFKPEYSSVVLF